MEEVKDLEEYQMLTAAHNLKFLENLYKTLAAGKFQEAVDELQYHLAKHGKFYPSINIKDVLNG